MRLGTLLLLFSMAGCWGHEEYQMPDRPMRRDGTMLCVVDSRRAIHRAASSERGRRDPVGAELRPAVLARRFR